MDAKRPDVRVDETSEEEADGVVTKRDRPTGRTKRGRVRTAVRKLVGALKR